MEQLTVEKIGVYPLRDRDKIKCSKQQTLRYLFRDTIMVVVKSSVSNQNLFIYKGFDKIHAQVLDLLKIPQHVYQINRLDWWKFNAT